MVQKNCNTIDDRLCRGNGLSDIVLTAVTVRELRNHGGEVIDRVLHGETMVVTRDGIEVAELRPLRKKGLSSAELIARRRHLPSMDDRKLRDDIDEIRDSLL